MGGALMGEALMGRTSANRSIIRLPKNYRLHTLSRSGIDLWQGIPIEWSLLSV
jgi:hypothetical protein